jgi:hypothetical protein
MGFVGWGPPVRYQSQPFEGQGGLAARECLHDGTLLLHGLVQIFVQRDRTHIVQRYAQEPFAYLQQFEE